MILPFLVLLSCLNLAVFSSSSSILLIFSYFASASSNIMQTNEKVPTTTIQPSSSKFPKNEQKTCFYSQKRKYKSQTHPPSRSSTSVNQPHYLLNLHNCQCEIGANLLMQIVLQAGCFVSHNNELFTDFSANKPFKNVFTSRILQIIWNSW